MIVLTQGVSLYQRMRQTHTEHPGTRVGTDDERLFSSLTPTGIRSDHAMLISRKGEQSTYSGEHRRKYHKRHERRRRAHESMRIQTLTRFVVSDIYVSV